MLNRLLFPRVCRTIGWILVLPSFAIGLAAMYAEAKLPGLDDFTDEVASLGLIVGLIFIGFSRTRIEDEMIGRLRLESLQWSIYVNYIFLILAVIFFYSDDFFQVMVYNMFTILLVFNIRFLWLLYKLSKFNATESYR